MVSMHGHSSKVELNLCLGDRKLSLSQVGPGAVYLQGACEPIPATNGTILITVDGIDHRMDVFFPNGIGNDGDRVVYF
jgi:hypothetical protein